MVRARRPHRRKATTYKGYPAVLSPASDPASDELTALEVGRVDQVQDYADGGPRPRHYNRFEVDPRLADIWFRRMAVAASAIQWRAMIQAMAEGASALQVQNGLRAAMEVQNRLFGKPIEKMAVVGRVKVEFGSNLNPDAFPKEAKETQAEIVEIPSDYGTHVDGDEEG